MPEKKTTTAKKNNGVNPCIENELREAAVKMREHLNVAEYKPVVRLMSLRELQSATGDELSALSCV